MAVDVGSAVGYLDLDISKFLSGLKSAQDEAGKTSTAITDKLDSAGGKLASIGTKATALVTTPIVGAGTAIVKTTANFESAMSKVSAISGATGDDLGSLTEKAKQMGENTKFSASEAADAFQYMAMAGWKTEQMLGGIEGIMNLAAASGEDLATTSDIVTDALTAFGLQAEDSSHFADILAAVSSNANTNVSMLGESFKFVAPVAGALGYSVEDVGVALGLMANSGIKAGQAGTTLRSAISGLISPSKDAAGWMEELGLSMTNEDGTMKSLSEVMDMLRAKMSGLSEAEQAQAASSLFGERAMSGMLAIVNASESDYNKLTEALANADGTAKDMADTMNDNLNGQLILLKSQIEGVAIKLGNILLPIIKKVVDKISEWVDWFSNLSEAQQETILKIAAIVAAIGPLLLVIGKVIKTISTIIKVVNSIKTVVIALNAVVAANPIILIITAIIAAVTALVAIFVHLYKTNEDFRNKVNAAWEKIKEVVGTVIDFIKQAWEALWNFVGPIFEKVWNGIKSAIGTIVNVVSSVVDTLKPLFEEISGAFEEAWEVIKLIWDKVASYFEGVWENIKTVFSVVKEFIGNAFQAAWEKVKLVWDVVGPYFEKIWEGIKKVFSVVGKVLGGFFKVAWTAIKAVWDVAVKFFTAVWAGIKAVFSVVKGILSGDFSDAWEAIKNVWDKVTDFFQAIWEGIKNVFSVIKDWFGDIFQGAVDAVTSVFSGVVNFFQGIWDGITSIFSAIGDWFKEKFQEAVANIILVWSTINEFFGNIWEGIKSIFSEIGTWFKNKFQEAVNNIKAVWSIVTNFFKNIWDGITSVFSSVGNWFKEKFQEAVDNVKAVWSIITSFFSGLWDDIKGVFSKVGNWFKDKFQEALDNIKAVFSGIKKFFQGIWDDIKEVFSSIGSKIGDAFSGAFKSVVNTIFEWIEEKINGFFDMINAAIDVINKIPGVDLGYIDHIQLPRLAKGGLAYGPTAAIVGDNKNATTDPEVIAPLSKLKAILSSMLVEPINKISEALNDVAASIRTAMSVKVIDITPLLHLMQELVYVQKASYDYTTSRTRQISESDKKDVPRETSSGDTFNFYTDRSIDEEEAARQIRKVKRDLLEGF